MSEKETVQVKLSIPSYSIDLNVSTSMPEAAPLGTVERVLQAPPSLGGGQMAWFGEL